MEKCERCEELFGIINYLGNDGKCKICQPQGKLIKKRQKLNTNFYIPLTMKDIDKTEENFMVNYILHKYQYHFKQCPTNDINKILEIRDRDKRVKVPSVEVIAIRRCFQNNPKENYYYIKYVQDLEQRTGIKVLPITIKYWADDQFRLKELQRSMERYYT